MNQEKFVYTAQTKKRLIMTAIGGVVVLLLGIIVTTQGSPTAHDATTAHQAFHWTQRLWTNLWINNVYFVGIAMMGVFFVALQYVAKAGWSAGLKRVPEAFGYWLPIGGMVMLILFVVAHHDLFHWTHHYLYDPQDTRYDAIIARKKAYLNYPCYVGRMLLYFLSWIFFFHLIRRESLAEDSKGGTLPYKKMVKYSAMFIILFAITSSTAAWDWVMSIDTHWYSTLLGWYVFSSWFISGLAAITLLVVFLKAQGYLRIINANHLHDLGKFVFAFSIFWTYIWFSQFLLIYYANIPEETIYFIERLKNYVLIFFVNLILNFAFPFVVLMTRDAKRYPIFLKIVCIVLLFGHWLDFYLMIAPGVLAEDGSFGLMEVGTILIYFAAFTHILLKKLASAPLIAPQHPLLQESIAHHT